MATGKSGNQPGSNPLTIGSVKFNSSECPVNLPIGGEQITVAQTLPGGSRIVQTFGPSPNDIAWTGRLFGAYVPARVAQMRLYMSSGNPVKLSWIKSTYDPKTGDPISQVKEQYTVTVRNFVPRFFAQYAEYDLTLCVVAALNGAYNTASKSTIDSQINALQSTADSITDQMLASSAADATEIASDMSVVKSKITAATPISKNPLSASSIQTAITTAQKSIAKYQNALPPGSFLSPLSIQLNGVLTSISRNVAAGYALTSVTQQGGNVFTIASQQYGDPSTGYALAKIAGLASPFLASGAFSNIKLPNLAGT
jgi:xanthosine utilization system XapX-like protein